MSQNTKLIVLGVLVLLAIGAGFLGYKAYNKKKYATVNVVLPVAQVSAEATDPDQAVRELLDVIASDENIRQTVTALELPSYYEMTEENSFNFMKGRIGAGIGDDGKTIFMQFKDKDEEKAKEILKHLVAVWQSRSGGAQIVSLPIGKLVDGKGDPKQFLGKMLQLVGSEAAVKAVIEEHDLKQHYAVEPDAEALQAVRSRIAISLADDKETVVLSYKDGDTDLAKKILTSLVKIYNQAVRNAAAAGQQQEAGQEPAAAE